MVIFHSYVSLPEGRWLRFSETSTILADGSDGPTRTQRRSALSMSFLQWNSTAQLPSWSCCWCPSGDDKHQKKHNYWIGLSENLQETHSFYHWIWGFTANVPLNKSNPHKYHTSASNMFPNPEKSPHQIITQLLLQCLVSSGSCMA